MPLNPGAAQGSIPIPITALQSQICPWSWSSNAHLPLTSRPDGTGAARPAGIHHDSPPNQPHPASLAQTTSIRGPKPETFLPDTRLSLPHSPWLVCPRPRQAPAVDCSQHPFSGFSKWFPRWPLPAPSMPSHCYMGHLPLKHPLLSHPSMQTGHQGCAG